MQTQTLRIIPKNIKTTSRHLPLLVFAFFMLFVLSFLIVKNLKKSNALSVSNFRAGNIISDYTMSNTSTMNEQQIQEFLTQKNPCGDTNIWRANQYSGYKYHIENGKFICLSQETFEYNGTKQTAAQVIYEAARDYRINPQVLLVLLRRNKVWFLILGQIVFSIVVPLVLVVLILQNVIQNITVFEIKLETLLNYSVMS